MLTGIPKPELTSEIIVHQSILALTAPLRGKSLVGCGLLVNRFRRCALYLKVLRPSVMP